MTPLADTEIRPGRSEVAQLAPRRRVREGSETLPGLVDAALTVVQAVDVGVAADYGDQVRVAVRGQLCLRALERGERLVDAGCGRDALRDDRLPLQLGKELLLDERVGAGDADRGRSGANP